jgi:hypothetical protein
LIELEDSHFISWLLHNQCEKHTTCETVNKSSDGILAQQHSDETVKVIVLSRSRLKNGATENGTTAKDKQVVSAYAACFLFAV